MLAAGCGESTPPRPAPINSVASRPVGSWAGRSGFQTEFFYSEHGRFRVRWRTRALAPTPQALAGAHGPAHRAVTPSSDVASFARGNTVVNLDEVGPYFELKLQSGVSGRQLGDAVERRTTDEGVLDFDEDPRDFYFAVRAHDMEWWFHVEELFTRPFVPDPTLTGPNPAR